MKKIIRVFEHQTLKVNRDADFSQSDLEALQHYYGEKGVPYYTLIHHGVRFNQYVGVIQVGHLMIEVLPKLDKPSGYDSESNKTVWLKILIDMLLLTTSIEAKITSTADLNLKADSILDVYFALFVKEVESLLHQGLIKQYHNQQDNIPRLKGRLNLTKHIAYNHTHKERFFVEYTVYDTHNIYNQIIYKTLKLLSQLNHNPHLTSRINTILFNFPEMIDCYVDDMTFNKIRYHRKNHAYQPALMIAKLLLLNYHPDVTKGRNSVLSLMFDMNQLWEKFVLVSLQRCNKHPNLQIKAQLPSLFWQSSTDGHHRTTIKADIVIHHHDLKNTYQFVVDTKWKCPNYLKPSSADLHQLHTYHYYYGADKVALFYPSSSIKKNIDGCYVNTEQDPNKICSLLFLHITENNYNIREWQEHIYQKIVTWCGIQ